MASQYVREFRTRPLAALAGGIVAAGVFIVITAFSGIFGVLGLAAIALGAGIAGFLTSTVRLDVGATVVQKSRLRTRSYGGSDLVLDARGGDLYVVRRKEKERAVVCVFRDADGGEVRDAFTAAGVDIVEAAPKPEAAADADADAQAPASDSQS